MRLKNWILSAVTGLAVSSLAAQNAPLWLRYPSISPDGANIVFSYMGDLYLVPTEGGQAKPLTQHSAHDYLPVWSDDSKTIAFASDRYGNFDVFTIPLTGGTPTRLTTHSSHDYPYDFSPDGKSVLFGSNRGGTALSAQFPYRRFNDLYLVPVVGGRERMFLNSAAEYAIFDKSGTKVYYQDRPGAENEFRKHHTSSVTRNLWMYDVKNDTHTQMTQFVGEDRNPILSPDGKILYFLSEGNGTMNVWAASLDNISKPTQLTTLGKHPVRNLTSSAEGLLCFSYDGELYTYKPGGQPAKVQVRLGADSDINAYQNLPVNGGVTEMTVSPSGKEVAFIFRGEVFVTSVDGSTTKRVTQTPGQERTLSWNPDGKSLVYAAERGESWDLVLATLGRKEENTFFNSTLIEETVLLGGPEETFQPQFSPDGKEIAYLEERTTLRVFNLASKKSRTVVPGDRNYSYSDGDQSFQWSPDGKWIAVEFLQPRQWISEIGVVSAQGGELKNLSQSGYQDYAPRWGAKGKMLLWFTDRDGMKNHGSWGSEADVYGYYLTQAAFDRIQLSEEELKVLKEKEEKEKKEEKKEEKGDSIKLPDMPIEWDRLEDRKVRLTLHSSRLTDAQVSPDGEKLYYLARFEKGNDLWVTNLRTQETKILAKLGAENVGMEMDKEGKKMFVLADGKISSVDLESGKSTGISVAGEMQLNVRAERAYMYEHVWRQVVKKFYVTDIHNVDWAFYKEAYAKFLPHIGNNYEFAEMLSELLGELNASHTGAYYIASAPNGDVTASLGAFYDETYQGDGLRIAEVIAKGPLTHSGTKVKAGTLIEKIDGVPISANASPYPLLNRKAGKNTLLSLFDPATKARWEEVVKPITPAEEAELRYHRWVEMQRNKVDKLSGGRLGYVHVRGMDNESFRQVYEDALGKHAQKEGLIVDTRFNGGGWLHDDLATFLDGHPYLTFMPRGQDLGLEPRFKWHKPSIVLVNEANYSDAHMFPYTYRAMGIGKIVGMPVAGTGTAVWWENLIDPTIRFGIPQVGMRAPQGYYLENTQFEPDVRQANEPKALRNGEDQQTARAVKELLDQLK